MSETSLSHKSLDGNSWSIEDLFGIDISVNQEVVFDMIDIKTTQWESLDYFSKQELTKLAQKKADDTAKLLLLECRFEDEQRSKDPFVVYDFEDEDSIAIPWIFEGFSAQDDLSILVGDSNVGKSFLLLDLAFAAITNKPFANQFNCSSSKKVLYIVGEGLPAFGKRVKGVARKYGLKQFPHDQLMICDFMPDFATGVGIFDLQMKLEKQGFRPDIIIIDTLSAALKGKNENDNSAVSKAFQLMKVLARPYNASLIVSHHTQKSSVTMYRGASAIRGNADNVYTLTKRQSKDSDESWSVLAVSKQRDSKAFANIGFQIKDTEDKLPFIEWYDSTNRKDGKLNLTEGELIIRHLMNHSEATLLELLDYLGKENTVVTRRNLKNITLKKLVLNGEILETEEGKYTLAEDDV